MSLNQLLWIAMRVFLERHQIAIYLASIFTGALVSSTVHNLSPVALIEPTLIALLFTTFMAIPLARKNTSSSRRAQSTFEQQNTAVQKKTTRQQTPPAQQRTRPSKNTGSHNSFLWWLLALNFLAVPLLVFLLTRQLDSVIATGITLVLLAPCIDYVVVFARIARGNTRALLAATPLLMLGQAIVIPMLLFLWQGQDVAAAFTPVPLVRALLLFIVIPVSAAWLIQTLEQRRPNKTTSTIISWTDLLMVPLMAVVLFSVVAGYFGEVATGWISARSTVPLYVCFGILSIALSTIVLKFSRLQQEDRVAITMSAFTRNSLVILPIGLAMPPSYAVVPVLIVTQTMVELAMMPIVIRAVPWLATLAGGEPQRRHEPHTTSTPRDTPP